MILKGISGLLHSRKGTLSLLVLIISSVAVMMGKIEGTAYAAIIGTVAVIYNFVQTRMDMASLPFQSMGYPNYSNYSNYSYPPNINPGFTSPPNTAIGTPDAPIGKP